MDESLKKEAIEFARSANVSVLATVSKSKGVNARVMQIVRVDDDFTVWFSTYTASDKFSEVKSDHKVCVIMSDNKTMTDIRLRGAMEIKMDQKTKDLFWQEEWVRFYSLGKTDPNYVILKLTPTDIEFRNMPKYGMVAKRLK